MSKKKYIPKEIVEVKQMRFDMLRKKCEGAIKRNDPDAEKLVEQLTQAYMSLGKSIGEHFVPKIKELDKTIQNLKRINNK